MKSVKKKQLFNIVMVVLIIAIVFSGVMFAGGIRGWFAGNSAVTVSDKLGSANIQREGIAYSLTKGTALSAGDIIDTLDGSTATFNIASIGSVVLGENTQAVIRSTEDDAISIEITNGEVFANINTQGAVSLALNVGDRVITAKNAVFSLSAPSGSQSVYVYSGSVAFAADNLSGEVTAQAGQAALLTSDSEGTVCSMNTLTAAALNDFLIAQVKTVNDSIELYFTDDELNAVVADRQNELLAAETEREAHEQELLAQGGNVAIPIDGSDAENTDSQEGPSTSVTTGNSSQGDSTSDEPAGTKPTDGQTQPTPTPTPEPTPAPDIFTCTISIRCDTILGNMENLVEGKAQYVPANGAILATSSVQFYGGETVFDVLKRACKAAGLQLEYSWTPMYDSYYIEGINHIYEFDCGSESGWMYKVNGWFPNYGCSAYNMEDGDKIVWVYTCNGLGADVGGSVN